MFQGAETMRSEITTRLETGFEGLSALLVPQIASTSLHSVSTANGAPHAIGSIPLPGASSKPAGSPPTQKPSFHQHPGLQQVQLLPHLADSKMPLSPQSASLRDAHAPVATSGK